MKWHHRWAVVDNPDTGEPPAVVDSFFFWTSAMTLLAFLDVFHREEYQNLEVIRL